MKISRIVLGFGLVFLLAAGGLKAVSNEITVKTVDQAGFEKLLDSNKNQVLLLNVWATWCKPCREEFPDLIKLAEYYKDKNVRIVSINTDYPDDIQSKILPFLKKFKINFPVYVQNFPKADMFIEALHKEWEGALPATFIYDKTGKQQAFFIGKKDFNGFRDEIEKVRKLKGE